MSPMPRPWSIAGAVALGALCCSAAWALTSTFLSSDFEGAAYTAGALLDGQDGWVAVTAPAAITVSGQNAHHGRRCGKFDGALLEKSLFASQQVEAVCGRWLNFDPVQQGTPVVRMRASVRLDGPSTPADKENDAMSVNFYTANDAGQNLGAFYVESTGKVWASGGGGPYNAFSRPYTIGTYVDLELVLDFDARTMTFVLDGQSMGSLPLHATPLESTELLSVAIEMNCRKQVNQRQREQYTAYFDDVSVTTETR